MGDGNHHGLLAIGRRQFILLCVSFFSFSDVSSLLSDKGLCPRCVVLLEEGGPFNDVTPPELPPLPASILNGVANVWKCPLCHEDVMTSKEKKSLFHSK